MTDINVKAYSEYAITDSDRLLFEAQLVTQDANGIAAARAKAALDYFTYQMASGTFKLKGSAALRFVGMEGSLFAYVLPKLVSLTEPAPIKAAASVAVPVPAAVPMAAFNNGKPANGATWFGCSLGDGKSNGSGWVKTTDMQMMINLGVKAVRLPIDPKYCMNADGTINMWTIDKALVPSIKLAISKGVSVVLDAHTYLLFTDPTIAAFWSLFAPAIEKAIGGPNSLFGIELANEPGKGSKDLTVWTEPLRKTIRQIRVAGYQGYIFAGAGDWNNMTFLPLALAEVERIGGVLAMDPYDRTIYTGHDYWNKDSDPGKTRNDMGVAVDGNINIAKRYDAALNAARRIGAKVCMTEIGGGITLNGPMPAYNGIGKNGEQLQDEYFAYAKANEDVLIGTWFWMGGRTSTAYRHKVEAGNPHTISLQRFW